MATVESTSALPVIPRSGQGGSAWTGPNRSTVRTRRKTAAAAPVRARPPRRRNTPRFYARPERRDPLRDDLDSHGRLDILGGASDGGIRRQRKEAECHV
jgi:hypothetical protein